MSPLFKGFISARIVYSFCQQRRPAVVYGVSGEGKSVFGVLDEESNISNVSNRVDDFQYKTRL